MLHKFFHFFVRRTHFWRTVSVSEMAELYVSRVMRVMAMNMLAGFGIVYIYQLGYSLSWIAWYYVAFFGFRLISSWYVAKLIAARGPKHAIAISNWLFIINIFLFALAAIPSYSLVALLLIIPVGGFGRLLYDAAYYIDFSKIKHLEHSGKEIGVMQVIEQIMTACGPILGGFIALVFGPVTMMFAAGIIMLVSSRPLFFSGEPVKISQRITLRHFNLKVAFKPMVGFVAIGIDSNISGAVWNMFVVIVVFGVVNNSSYLQLGLLSSVALLASLFLSYIYGRLVDNHSGKKLMWWSVIGQAVVDASRAFVTTPTQVAAVNVANQATTIGYQVPVTRGVFDTADGLPGYRIVYITMLQSVSVVGNLIVVLVLALLTTFFNDVDSLKITYLVLSPLVLLIGLNSVAIYRRGVLTRFIHRV